MVGQKEGEQDAQALGHAIRVIRTERGLNRKELAERSGISYPFLSEIEAGKKSPSTKTLSALGEALGIRPAEFLAAADSLAQGPRLWSNPPKHQSAPLPASPRSFFTVEQDQALEMKPQRMFEPAGLMGEPEADPGRRRQLMKELQRSTRHLTPEDLELLVDFARRLGDH